MPEMDAFGRLANFIQEPLLVVTGSGQVELANNEARILLGDALAGRHIGEFTTTARAEIEDYLKRCAQSGSPVVGAMTLRSRDGSKQRHQTKGALLSTAQGSQDARIMLSCSAAAFRNFSLLAGQVEELNQENRKHRHARTALQEAVSQRDVLLREVQHRVRNITQMMLGMVASARREAQSEELSRFLERLRQRLMALGTVQQLMYASAQYEAISASALVNRICDAIRESWPAEAGLKVESIDAELSNDVAVPFALILNELLSNALKHGLDFGRGTVEVEFGADGQDLVLTVSDSGPGFGVGRGNGKRHSGLELVRGLCRQIGGVLAVNSGSGASCTVRFPQSDT